MALPSNVGFGKVTGVFLRATGDGPDADSNPDGVPLAGLTVKFSASVMRVKNTSADPPVTIIVDTVTCTTDDSGVLIDPMGNAGLWLVASTDPDLDPTGWTWTATISASTIPSFSTTFSLDVGQTLDLASLIPVPSNPGTQLAAWQAVVAQITGDVGGVQSLVDEASESATASAASASAAAASATEAAEARDAAVAAVGDVLPVWDAEANEYTSPSMASFMRTRRDGQIYGVDIPKGMATDCTKTAANSGIPNPTPGVIGTPAIDPYLGRGAFRTVEVNAFVDPDGTAHVTGISGDGRFKRDGSNGDVWILAPTLWWNLDTTSPDTVALTVSDSPAAGLSPQPKAYLPDGSLRPYMLYAKYAMSIVGGVARSVSGRPIANRNVSHNSLITQCKTASTGYAGKSFADDWYVKAMFLLKYATKNSQSVFAGVSSWNIQTPITVAESGTTRVIIATSQAANIPVGSALMLGSTTTAGQDRNAATSYDVFDALRVTRKETYDASNTAIYVNAAAAFNTTVGTYLSTAPWNTGACDQVVGDGSPSSRTNGREPFTVQGIELGLGMNEIVGDVILKSDGSTGWQIYVNPDSKNEATAVNANYQATGKYNPSGASDAGFYQLYPDSAGGFLVGAGTGASQSTGLCDQVWSNGTAVTGEREWRSLGDLRSGGGAGFWFVNGTYGLTIADWGIGSRLSAVGRSQ